MGRLEGDQYMLITGKENKVNLPRYNIVILVCGSKKSILFEALISEVNARIP